MLLTMALVSIRGAEGQHGGAFRILHTNFHLGWGGQAARVFLLCRSLKRMGLNVTVAAPGGSALIRKCAAEGIECFDDVRFSKGFCPADFVHDVLALRGLIIRRRIELVHTHGSQDTWSGSIAAWLSPRRPFVVRTRHNTFPVANNFLNRLLYARLIDRLVIVSESVKREYEKFISAGIISDDRIVTIHSCIEQERFWPSRANKASAREALGLPKEAPVVAIIARLAEEKGHRFLLQALASLRHEFANIIAVIAGEGNQEAFLKSYAAELGIAQNVRFLGFREDVDRILAAADVAVLPSVACDASSASIKEAMAMQRPVVATHIGGAAEIIENGKDGIIVPPGDPVALADAISRLLRNPSMCEAIGRAGRRKVVATFTEERLARQTLSLYRSLLGPKGEASE